MRAAAGHIVGLCCALLAFSAAAEDENKDIQLIPGAPSEETAPAQGQSGEAPSATTQSPAPVAQGKLYVEDAFTAWSLRSGLVVPLPPTTAQTLDWQNRTSLDGTHQWNLSNDVTATLSDRLNLYEENDIPIPSHQDFRNDFREGYVTLEAAPQNYIEAGRINVKNGSALGYNPTDFFKTRTLLDIASEDPSVLREDRLGTAMVRGQTIFTGGSASFAFAPKLASPSAVYLGAMPSVNPMFDRTNGYDRMLLEGSYDLIPDVSTQLLYYRESNFNRVGANVSRPIGDAIIAYGEWAGGRQRSLIDTAEAYGLDTGTLPSSAIGLLSSGHGTTFQNDAAVGASWTSSSKVTVNLEYHYHQAGFTGQDWRNWFAVGHANAGNVPVTGELWYLRAYAQEQEEPLSRQEIFARADWTDAFVPDLELSAFAFVDLYDASVLTQASATYYLSDHWTVGALVGASLGSPHSEYGSFRQDGSAILQLVHYF